MSGGLRVAAVVLVVAIGEAGKARAEDALRNLGDNLVWVEAGSRNVAGVRTGSHGTTSLMLDDAEAIRREVPFITRLSPQIDGTIHLIHGDRDWTTRFPGETPDYLALKRFAVARGAAFTDEDVTQSASKVVIGETVRQQLFGATGSSSPTPPHTRSWRQGTDVARRHPLLGGRPRPSIPPSTRSSPCCASATTSAAARKTTSTSADRTR